MPGRGSLWLGRSRRARQARAGKAMRRSCKPGTDWESHAQAGQGRLRIGMDENVEGAGVQSWGTGLGFCFGPDLKNSGTEKGQVSEK